MRAATSLLLGLAALVPSAAHAATIVVDSTSTAASLPGACTLRAAVNAALTGDPVGGCPAGDPQEFTNPLPNSIELPPGAVFTFDDADPSTGTQPTALPLIAFVGTLTIEGHGATIERSDQLPLCTHGAPIGPEEFGLIQVFGAGPSAHLVLRDLTLRNGCATGPGGAVNFDQAIGSLTLDGVRVIGSRGTSGSAVYFAASGDLDIRGSYFAQNVASQGGVLFTSIAAGHAARVQGSTFAGNVAFASMLRAGGAGSYELRDNTFSGNVTTGQAVGVGQGVLFTGSGAVALLHNTFVDNDTWAGLPILTLGGNSTVRMQGNWFAGNADSNCGFGNATVLATGANLSTDLSCPQFGQVDPGQLRPLGFYGGRVPTRPPTQDSVAIDVSSTCTHPATGAALGTDARGVPRPQDGDMFPGALCDAGATEYVRNQAPSIALPAPAATLVDQPLPLAPIVLSDPDARDLPIELRLEPDNGVVDFDASALDCTTGDGSADPVAICRGSVAQLNAALATVTYQPRPGFAGEDALLVEVDDLGAGGDDAQPRGAAANLAIQVLASAAIIAVATPVDFGDVVVGTESLHSAVEIVNLGNLPLNVLFTSMPPAGSGFRLAGSCTNIAPGGGCALEVWFAPTAVGPESFDLMLASNAANGIATVTLRGNGRSDPDALFGDGFE